MNGIQLIFEDRRGVWIPRDFAEEIDHSQFTGYSQDDVDELERIGNKEDPDLDETELYWEIWDRIIMNAEYIDHIGNKWFLHQDGDVFIVCPELMTNEEKRNFYFNEDLEDDEEEE